MVHFYIEILLRIFNHKEMIASLKFNTSTRITIILFQDQRAKTTP